MKTETRDKIAYHICTFTLGFYAMLIVGVFFPDMIVIRHPKPANPCEISLPANALAHGVGAGTWKIVPDNLPAVMERTPWYADSFNQDVIIWGVFDVLMIWVYAASFDAKTAPSQPSRSTTINPPKE